MDEKKNKSFFKKAINYFSGGILLFLSTCILVPKIIKKGAGQIYKVNNLKNEVDFDNLGPKIIRKEDEE